MKKYIKMLPVIFYPYLYLVLILCMAMDFGFIHVYKFIPVDLFTNGFIMLVVGVNLYSLVASIINSVQAARGKYTASQSALMNLIIKGVHIPAYIFHFIMGMMGTVMSVWGIGFILWAIVIDLLTIITTGINAIGVSISGYKENIWSKKRAVLFGILNFIYCVDVVVAIIEFIMTKTNDIKSKHGERR